MRGRRRRDVAEIAVGMEAEPRCGMCLCMVSPWLWFDLVAIGLELPLLVWGLFRWRPPPRPGIGEGALVAATSATIIAAVITLMSGGARSELSVAFTTLAVAGAALVALVHTLGRLPDAREEEPLAAARAIATSVRRWRMRHLGEEGEARSTQSDRGPPTAQSDAAAGRECGALAERP